MPAPRDPAHCRRDRPEPRGSRDDDRTPALVDGPARRARRAAVRAREALVDPAAPPSTRRDAPLGRGLAAPLRLRRSGERGAQRPRARWADRRVDARQALGAGSRGGCLPRPAVPEPALDAKAGPRPLRRADERRGADHRRRNRDEARRRHVLRDHDLERRGRGRAMVRLVAGRLAHGRAADRRDTGAGRRQPGGPARTRDPHAAHRPRLRPAGVCVPRRQAGQRGRRRGAVAADRVCGGARVRDPFPLRPRRASVGCDPRCWRPRRDPTVRPRAAAHPASGKAAHHRRAGHRLRIDATGCRNAMDGQARQAGGIHRQVGAGAGRRTSRRRRRSSASRSRTGAFPPRAR